MIYDEKKKIKIKNKKKIKQTKISKQNVGINTSQELTFK